MKIRFRFNSTVVTDSEANSLMEFLNDSEIDGIDSIERIHVLPPEEELGTDWLPIIEIFMASQLLNVLVQTFSAWRISSRTEVEIEMDIEGMKITTKGKNADEVLKEFQKLENGINKKA